MNFFLRRLTFFLLTLWAALTLNFFLPRLVPGNPIGAMLAQSQGRLNPEAVHALKLAYGISDTPQPLYIQYFEYIGKLFQGDFGRSISQFPMNVTDVIAGAAPWTIGLVGISTIISFVLGSLLGLWTAWKRGNKVADAMVPFGLFLNSMPYFWFALISLYLFAYLLNWFPLSGGYESSKSPADGWAYYKTVLWHGFLPAFTIIVTGLGGWLVGMRNNAVSVLNEDYVTFAEAKGLKPSRIKNQYVARNAILPSITGFGMALGFVVGGSIVTEIVFSYPGIGRLLYQAVTALDYPLMQGIFLFITATVLIANLLVEISYVFLDPRVRGGK
ncbi:ABC transporter permease [Deinococcus cellulosilyticus]|uniref:Peptide ABC transporter permease n=1 Tax=Deinococcus cellulosilyticus (strain DSM 18568 / NBRC 106333 / KACC 11606 / 5516J-15) TaxID=1223518 RepID=A0A511N856_DEIC1|nr:ABC transporter permease [Deinococcus cellulosilyticus]GEM49022.1 peptide ABC transporter permease [Deinococcus cellulosilyticus NBRC 106333 = KACC 11606]